MSDRILCVDDDQNILNAYYRYYRKIFNLSTCNSGADALNLLEREPTFAVIVSDMQMPGMDGITLLKQVKSRWPDITRIMLTGNEDQGTAMKAVNEGQIFKFMTKPCNSDAFIRTVTEGIHHHQLLTVESELLELTLTGTVKMMAEVFSFVSPKTFGQLSRINSLAVAVAEKLKLKGVWRLEIATTISQLSYAVNQGLVEHFLETTNEARILGQADQFKHAMDMIKLIPRLESITGIISGLNTLKRFKETDQTRPNVGIESEILFLIYEYEQLCKKGEGKEAVAKGLERRFRNQYGKLLDALLEVIQSQENRHSEWITVEELTATMTLAEDIRLKSGGMLVAAGQELNEAACVRLKAIAQNSREIQEPVKIFR